MSKYAAAKVVLPSEVSGGAVHPESTTAVVKWVSQKIPNIKWAIFNSGVNISGVLKVTTYTITGLVNNTTYNMTLCSSIDGKTWTKGRKLQFKTKKMASPTIKTHKVPPTPKPKPAPKPKPPPKPKSKYAINLPPDVTNTSIVQKDSSVTLSWTTTPDVIVKITDGCGYLSPPINGVMTYTVSYGDISSASLYIMSSYDDVNYTTGVEVRSVIPDVTNVDFTINPDMSVTVTFKVPITNFSYSVSDLITSPTNNYDGEILITQNIPPTQNPDGSYVYISQPGQNFCTIFGYSNIPIVSSYTYGTTIYFYTQDATLPSEVSDIVQVPRSDGSGVDVSFTGYASSYTISNGYDSSFTTQTPNGFIPYSWWYGNSTIVMYISSTSDQGSTNGIPFSIAFPTITNVQTNPGPTSLQISWTPGPNPNPSSPQTWRVLYGDHLVDATTPNININYSDIPPNSMIFITSNYASYTFPLTRAFFWPGNQISSYVQETTNNNTLLIAVILVVLFLLLKNN